MLVFDQVGTNALSSTRTGSYAVKMTARSIEG